MKKIYSGLVIGAAMLIVGATQAFAAPNWNVTGSWNAVHEYQGNTYTHYNNITQATNGTLTGNGGLIGGPYTWNVTAGSWVNGNRFHMNYHYTAGAVCDGWVDATIYTDGSMFGQWHDNCGGNRTASWTVAVGTAKKLVTNMNDCKNGGWKTLTGPTFRNQGSCVSYFQSNYHAGKRN